MSSCSNDQCRCVGLTVVDRCVAIRQYVRPEDVEHFIERCPPWALPANHSSANAIARWLRQQFTLGVLRYIPDPDDCDRWGRPSETFRRRGGDCDDLAILVASFCRAMGVPMHVIVGEHCDNMQCGGHAWVEGQDEHGWFLLEATSGNLYRYARPAGYQRQLLLTPETCAIAPEATASNARLVAQQVNQAVLNAQFARMFGLAS